VGLMWQWLRELLCSDSSYYFHMLLKIYTFVIKKYGSPYK
jgi:hypothetical protein